MSLVCRDSDVTLRFNPFSRQSLLLRTRRVDKLAQKSQKKQEFAKNALIFAS